MRHANGVSTAERATSLWRVGAARERERRTIHSEMMTSTFSGRRISSTLPLMTSIVRSNPLALTLRIALNATLLASTAYTLRAPACAANIERMPVPHPTSRTTLPSKRAALDGCRMKERYASVRTRSLSMIS